MKKIDISLKTDHVNGGFEWDIEPSCCNFFKEAVQNKFIFVSNTIANGYNLFYIMPLDYEGYLFKSDGMHISNCPWCGNKIQAKKKQ